MISSRTDKLDHLVHLPVSVAYAPTRCRYLITIVDLERVFELLIVSSVSHRAESNTGSSSSPHTVSDSIKIDGPAAGARNRQ